MADICRFCRRRFAQRARFAEHQLQAHRLRLTVGEFRHAAQHLGAFLLSSAQVALLELGERRAVPPLPGHAGHSLRRMVERGWFRPEPAAEQSLLPVYRLTELGRMVLAARKGRIEYISTQIMRGGGGAMKADFLGAP